MQCEEKEKRGRAPSQQAINTNGESKIVEKRKNNNNKKKKKRPNKPIPALIYVFTPMMSKWLKKGGTRDHPNIDQSKKKSK